MLRPLRPVDRAAGGCTERDPYETCCLDALLLLTGCSVGMALSGGHTPDPSAVKVGAARGEVELQLGHPVKESTLPDGRQSATYEFEMGNEPMRRARHRPRCHGRRDVRALAVGTPIEAVQVEKRRVVLTYDKDDRIAAIHHMK